MKQAKPIRFESLYKQTLWGGDKIAKLKQIGKTITQVGESWEISGITNSETVVSEGKYKGFTLTELLCEMQESLVGKSNYQRFKNSFPILVKFIDAKEDLSIQVHPNDEMAHRYGHRFGKNEMWYVLQAEPDSLIHVGLKEQLTPVDIRSLTDEGTIGDAVANYKVKAGDCFNIPAGRIHSIGKGCLLVEKIGRAHV